MNFELTEAQEEIVRQVRTLCTNYPDEYWREHDRRAEFPHDFFAAVAAAGYLGVAIPERYGGSGLGITEAALVMREVAASGGAMAAASAIHLSIFGVSPLVFHGSEEQKLRYLPKVVSGEMHVAFAVTEPDAGNDITHIKTAARRDGDNYLINGRKVFTTKAREAQRMLLLTRTTPFEQVTKKTDGMSLFFAELEPVIGRNSRARKTRPRRRRYQPALYRQPESVGVGSDRRRGPWLSLPARRFESRTHPGCR